jgi:hypothetical protein
MWFVKVYYSNIHEQSLLKVSCPSINLDPQQGMNMRHVALLALLAVATAIPTMNIPEDETPSTGNVAEDTMHAQFVVWKAKVRSLLEFVLNGPTTLQP